MPTDSTNTEDPGAAHRAGRPYFCRHRGGGIEPGECAPCAAEFAAAYTAQAVALERRGKAEDAAVRVLERHAREEVAARVRAVRDSASWRAHNRRAEEAFAAADRLREAPRRAAEAERALDQLAEAIDAGASAADLAAAVYAILAERERAGRERGRSVGL